MLLQMAGFPSFLWWNNIPLHLYICPSFIHSFVAKDLDRSHICLLRKMLFTHLLAIWMSCMGSLFILDINHLSNIRFASIFSHSRHCIFILLIVSFAVFFIWHSPSCWFLVLLLLEKMKLYLSWKRKGRLACCSPRGHKESATTEPLNWTGNGLEDEEGLCIGNSLVSQW